MYRRALSSRQFTRGIRSKSIACRSVRMAQTLASVDLNGTIRLLDAVSGTPKRTLTGHATIVTSVSFSPDSSLLASGSWDKTIRLWDTMTGTLKQTLTGHTDNVFSVSFSLDGSLLASGGSDKTIRLWDTDDWHPQADAHRAYR